jgi:tRNA pseudouridine55 synthase
MTGTGNRGMMRDGKRRGVDGVLLLDKPPGITSHTAVRRVRSLYCAAKAGHTGTLDPLATGLLPVCLGEATKFSHVLLEADKTYLASILLGVATTTGDLEGEVTARAPARVDRRQVETVLERFIGQILQTPPMYSAIKRAGQPLYKLARAGGELPRAPRRIRIGALNLVAFETDRLDVSVTCSRGTYIRVLAEDIGRALGCGACLAALRRTAVGRFWLDSGTVTLEQLEPLTLFQRDALLLPADALVASLPRFDLDAGEAQRLSRGQPIERAEARAAGLARVYGPDLEFLGVAEVIAPGRIVPRRLKSQTAAA